jgi:hypothetical protein
MCVVEFMSLLLKSPITVLTCDHTCSGDAYIVVAWLEEQESTLDEDRIEIINTKRCINMLKVADGILSCLAEHQEKTGIDLNGRIGVATGDVISGVLGLLQPRFCVFGEGMCLAAELEQTGTKGTVHCSTEFLQFVAGRHSVAMHHKASYNAELRFEYSTCKRAKKGTLERLRQKSAAFVSRMEKQGRLLRQQNKAASEPPASSEEFKPVSPVRFSSPSTFHLSSPSTLAAAGPFGLAPSIDMNGNFLSCHGQNQYLERRIDKNGMLVLSWTSSTALSKLDWGTSVPKGKVFLATWYLLSLRKSCGTDAWGFSPAFRFAPATAVQHESRQFTPNNDSVTRVAQSLQQIMQKTTDDVERPGVDKPFDEIVPE